MIGFSSSQVAALENSTREALVAKLLLRLRTTFNERDHHLKRLDSESAKEFIARLIDKGAARGLSTEDPLFDLCFLGVLAGANPLHVAPVHNATKDYVGTRLALRLRTIVTEIRRRESF